MWRDNKCRLNMRDLSERPFISEFQITVFQIMQEMSTNIVRHSDAQEGIGILGMKERAALLKGHLTVCSTPEAGTMVLLRIPLSEA